MSNFANDRASRKIISPRCTNFYPNKLLIIKRELLHGTKSGCSLLRPVAWPAVIWSINELDAFQRLTLLLGTFLQMGILAKTQKISRHGIS